MQYIQIWSEVIWQNCHHKCQSLLPWSTDTEGSQSGGCPFLVPVADRQALAVCHSIYLRERCHPWRDPSPLQPSLSTSATLQLFVSQCGSLATCLPSVDVGITVVLSTYFIIVSYLNYAALLRVSVGLLIPLSLSHSCLQPMSAPNSPDPQTG